MENSRIFSLVGLGMGLVSCAAAVLVVPEVRCKLGLDPALTVPGSTCAARPGGTYGAPWLSAASAMEAQLAPIRARFEEVEAGVAAGRYSELRKEIRGAGGDSAYATVYVDGSAFPKIRARIFASDLRTSVQAYYRGDDLVFVYRTVNRMLPAGPRRLEEQRYYFSRGRMIRWLDASHAPVPPGSAAFIEAEARMSALADRLWRGARSNDVVIAY